VSWFWTYQVANCNVWYPSLDSIHTCSKGRREVGTLICRTLHTKPQTNRLIDEIFKLKTQIVPFWWHCIHTDFLLTKILPSLLYILLLQKWQKMKPQLYRLRWGESHIYSPSSNVICRNSMLHPLHFMQCCTTPGELVMKFWPLTPYVS